ADSDADLTWICEEISEVTDRMLSLQLPQGQFCKRVTELATCCSHEENDPFSLISPIEACMEAISTQDTIAGCTLLCANLLSIDPRRWGIQNFEHYTPHKYLHRLSKVTPAQILSHPEETSLAKKLYALSRDDPQVVVTTPESLMDLQLSKLRLPLRTVHLF